MAWNPDSSNPLIRAAYQLQREFQMNAENAAREAAGREKQTDLYNRTQEEATRKVRDFYEASAEGQEAMDQERNARLQQKRQEVIKKMMDLTREFMNEGSKNLPALGNSAPAAFSSGTAAATHLARMGGTGLAGAGGFATLGLIASVAVVVTLCAILVTFAVALNEVAKDNAKRRAELEAARTKALIEWEKNAKVQPVRNMLFAPKNL